MTTRSYDSIRYRVTEIILDRPPLNLIDTDMTLENFDALASADEASLRRGDGGKSVRLRTWLGSSHPRDSNLPMSKAQWAIAAPC